MRIRPFTIPLVVAVLTGVLLSTGCTPTLVKTTPKLPPGFVEARVPPGDIYAYLYLSQESPTSIPVKRFAQEASKADPSLQRPDGLPATLELDNLAAWAGSDLEAFAARVAFHVERGTDEAEKLLAGRADVKTWRGGKQLSLVAGTGTWAQGMQGSLGSGEGAPFQEAFPAAWDLLRLLPEKPPSQPVGAGFIRVDATVIDSLTSKTGIQLQGVAQALGTVRVTNIAFIAYADKPLAIPVGQVTPKYLKDAGVGAIFVVQSEYPGFLLSFFLNNFAGQLNLKKESLPGGQDVLASDLKDTYLLVKALGNTIFLTLAPGKDKAESLMTSVLEAQGQK